MRAIEEQTGVKGCVLCGGFGHRIANCPKAEERRQKFLRNAQLGGERDEAGGGM